MNQNQEKNTVTAVIDAMTSLNIKVECTGSIGPDRAFIVAQLAKHLNCPIVVVVPSLSECDLFINNLQFFLHSTESIILKFPAYHLMPFKHMAYHTETKAQRIRTLYHLAAESKPYILVTSIDALFQKVLPKQEIIEFAELAIAGEELNRDRLIEKLVAGGYTQTAVVEEPGDFCIRGGIMDIFSPQYPDPIRLEFFGDQIDSIRFFSAATQRKIKIVDEVILLPAREPIIRKDQLDEIVYRIRSRAAVLNIQKNTIRELISKLQNELTFPGMESQLSLIYPTLNTLFDYISPHARFVLIEPVELEKSARIFQEKIQSNYTTCLHDGKLCVEPDSLFLSSQELHTILLDKHPLVFKSILMMAPKEPQDHPCLTIELPVQDNSEIISSLKFQREKDSLLAPLVNWIQDKTSAGFATILVCSSKNQIKRLGSLLQPYGIDLNYSDGFPDVRSNKRKVTIALGNISSGFVWEEEWVAIITENEIFGKKHSRKKQTIQEVRSELLTFDDLKKGDVVVHKEHGIGLYQGLTKIHTGGVTNDYILIQFKDNDKLYLPVDRMNMIQKYIGVEGIMPTLDKMGGKSWDIVKQKAKKSAEKIAGSLLKLYAERKVMPGHSFTYSDNYLKDFEAGFPYEETPDQLRAIEDVLRDMVNPMPMDRLICGDVGYGKTEVALRASFVAVNDGKQVAVLVPTTILAEQHLVTFSSRFERFPIHIECLTRFRSQKEQRDILNRLKNGSVDIVIGTHRLLQNDVEFKDLGLLIVDEEHRFGVKDKEKLKKIRTTVDVLSLTATPIPRTLHMSLAGVRDMSVISTPPEARHPIITYICEFDDTIISEAIRKELSRNGQVFFVHNIVQTLDAMANYIHKLVPEARIDIAHGQMKEDALEKVMLRFMKKEIDVLVCTTIIEAGLDIPSANTILVNRADKFGMAQMYQLRGRVGRANEQAYAYLFIPPDTTLTKDAQKRLKVLMEYSDLGSGFHIAMNDLRIRGGGAILGASQSGHISAVGYDMYLELIEKAVLELKGEPIQEKIDPEINLPVSAYFSEEFIPDIDQRLSAYRRLARMNELTDVADFKFELKDRFGNLPNEATNLLLKVMLKILCVKGGIRRLDLIGYQLHVYFSDQGVKNSTKLVELIMNSKGKFELTPNQILKVNLAPSHPAGLLVQARNYLKEILAHVNDESPIA